MHELFETQPISSKHINFHYFSKSLIARDEHKANEIILEILAEQDILKLSVAMGILFECWANEIKK